MELFEKEPYILKIEKNNITLGIKDTSNEISFHTEKEGYLDSEKIFQIKNRFEEICDKNSLDKESFKSFADISHTVALELNHDIERTDIKLSENFSDSNSFADNYNYIKKLYNDIEYERLITTPENKNMPVISNIRNDSEGKNITQFKLLSGNNKLKCVYDNDLSKGSYNMFGNVSKNEFEEFLKTIEAIDSNILKNTKEINFYPRNQDKLKVSVKELPDDGGYTGSVEIKKYINTSQPSLKIENFLKFNDLSDMVFQNQVIAEDKNIDVENYIAEFTEDFFEKASASNNTGWTNVELSAGHVVDFNNLGKTFGSLMNTADKSSVNCEINMRCENEDFKMSFNSQFEKLSIKNGNDILNFEGSYKSTSEKDMSVITKELQDNGEIENIIKNISENFDNIKIYSCELNNNDITKEIDTDKNVNNEIKL
jgi:hypothetical protein